MSERTTIEVDVAARTGQARRAMSNLSQSFYIAGGAASRFGTVTRASFAGIVAGAAAFAAVKFTDEIIKASKLFIEFNDTLARTRAILADSNGVAKGFGKLKEEILQVGRTTRFTASEVGEAANKLAIAGVSAEEMVSEKALENLVKFAIAGGVDIETATNIGIAGVKAFGMEMSELSTVSDVLTKTFTRSNVDIVSLGEALKFAAPVAHSAKIGIEETAAAIGALGNAGLRGTVAGTGLRMSINKLLKPTFDAQRAMQDLGLNVRVLSPSGQAAEAAFKSVSNQLDMASKEAAELTNDLKILNDQMTDLSIEQKRNSLAITQIRERAARQNRDLTDQELSQIDRLEKANTSLGITEQELSLQRMIKARDTKKAAENEKALNAEAQTLSRTVEQQTIGITSLGDVLDQLASSGATTTQVLEIFGVRGGTAMASLLSQRESFHELVKLNEDAAGATAAFTASLQEQVEAGGSARERLLLFNSAIQEALLKIGEPFVIMLTKVADIMKGPLSNAIKENTPALKELGQMVGELFVVMGGLFIDSMPDIIQILKGLVPVVMVIVTAFRVLLAVIAPVFQVLSGVYNMIAGIAEAAYYVFVKGDYGKAYDAVKRAGVGLGDILEGGLSVVMGGGMMKASKALGAGKGAAMMSGMGGSIVGGAAGTIGTGGSSGGLGSGSMKAYAYGGVVNTPTMGLVGEAGPEAIVPLSPNKRGAANAVMNQAGLGGVTIGDIVINGGSNLSSGEIRAIIRQDLPPILRQEMMRGRAGVI